MVRRSFQQARRLGRKVSVPWEIPRGFEAVESSEAADRFIRRSADQSFTLIGLESLDRVYFLGAAGAAAGAAAAGAKVVSTRLIMSSVMSIAGSA